MKTMSAFLPPSTRPRSLRSASRSAFFIFAYSGILGALKGLYFAIELQCDATPIDALWCRCKREGDGFGGFDVCQSLGTEKKSERVSNRRILCLNKE